MRFGVTMYNSGQRKAYKLFNDLTLALADDIASAMNDLKFRWVIFTVDKVCDSCGEHTPIFIRDDIKCGKCGN